MCNWFTCWLFVYFYSIYENGSNETNYVISYLSIFPHSDWSAKREKKILEIVSSQTSYKVIITSSSFSIFFFSISFHFCFSICRNETAIKIIAQYVLWKVKKLNECKRCEKRFSATSNYSVLLSTQWILSKAFYQI